MLRAAILTVALSLTVPGAAQAGPFSGSGDRLERKMLRLSRAHWQGVLPPCGPIRVHVVQMPHRGQAHIGECILRISLKIHRDRRFDPWGYCSVFVHEYGHLVLQTTEHSPDSSDVMSDGYAWTPRVCERRAE